MELQAHFESLMNKSPISQADVTSFLRDMRRTPSGTLVTSKLLAEKVQSTSEAQAIQAFQLLESCLSSETEGSIEFRTEIGRYRFLNEIIRILSPKYMGDKTSPAVKERAVNFLEEAAGSKRKQYFPSEHSKILSVYQSLVDGGVIKSRKYPSTEADEEAELQKSIFDRAENAAILKKLLQSKDPGDLQAANRLIKNLVEEETRRIERRAELHSLIDRIDTSTSLLTEMLSQPKIDKEIVDELADTCRSLRQRLGGVATETNDETTSLLFASENLGKVLDFYEQRKDSKDDETTNEPQCADEKDKKPQQTLSLADELLLKLDIGTTTEEELTKKDAVIREAEAVDNLLNFDIDLNKPFNLVSNIEPDKLRTNPLDDIGKLSRELMEQSLLRNVSCNSNIKRNPDKTPLSQIRIPSIEKNDPSSTVLQDHIIPTTQANQQDDPLSLLDFGFLDTTTTVKETLTNIKTSTNSLLLDFNQETPKLSTPTNSQAPMKTSSDKETLELRKFLNSIKDLNLDDVDLISGIKPIDLELEEDGSNVALTMTFATLPDIPPSIKVGIITFTNKHSSSGLCNYVFQLIPPKGLQVKLLPPATMELEAWKKSFLPPPLLTQVALIVIPQDFYRNLNQSVKPKMKFILSYTTDDDDTALHNGSFDIPSTLLSFKMPM